MALGDYLQFVLALAFVLALILAVAWVFRRYGRGGVNVTRRGTGARRRLAVVEAVAIDTRRRLVLVRRDDREHLLVLGQQGETVVEAGIRIPADESEILSQPSHPKGTDDGSGRGNTSFLRLVRQSSRQTS